MTKETMNVHKALIELNTLEKRIRNSIANAKFCVANRANNSKIDGIEIAEFEKIAKADKQAIDDMMQRYQAIKRAIVLSNATTKVDIVGEKYTVAEAIYMKNHGFDFEVNLMATINQQYNRAVSQCNMKNDLVPQQAEDYVMGMYGGSDKNAKNSHQDKIDEYIANNTYHLVDPIGVLDEYHTRSAKYDNFMAEVDAALSTSNAMTTIEIEY